MRLVFASHGYVSGQDVNFKVYNSAQSLIFDGLASEFGTTGNYYIDISLEPTELYLIIAEEENGAWKASRYVIGGVDLKDYPGSTGPMGPMGPQGNTGPGVPTGGTAGQVLSKINGTDYNTEWVTISPKRKFNAEIFYANTLSNGSWFRRAPGDNISGSYSGYPSAYPFVLPFACTITKVFLNISGAGFDWRSSAGDIFADLGVFTLAYNGSTQIYSAGLTITGSFINGSFAGQSIKRVITSFETRYGSNSFSENDLIGFMLKKESSRTGQCNNLVGSYLSIEFTEV